MAPRAHRLSGSRGGHGGRGGLVGGVVRAELVLLLHLLPVQGRDTRQALVGSRVLLPCSCPHQTKAFLVWQTADKKVVDNYRPESEKQDVDRSFQNRTRLFYSAENHNCSLLLSQVSVKDERNYSCYYMSDQLKRFDVELLVAAQYSVQVESVPGDATKDSRSGAFRCQATGGFPVAHISWLLNGSTVPSEPPTEQQSEDGLYNLSSSVSIGVREGSVLECVVQNPRLEDSVHAVLPMRSSVTTDVTVTHVVSEQGRSVSPARARAQPWVAVVGVMMVLTMLLVALLTVSYRRRSLPCSVRLCFPASDRGCRSASPVLQRRFGPV